MLLTVRPGQGAVVEGECAPAAGVLDGAHGDRSVFVEDGGPLDAVGVADRSAAFVEGAAHGPLGHFRSAGGPGDSAPKRAANSSLLAVTVMDCLLPYCFVTNAPVDVS